MLDNKIRAAIEESLPKQVGDSLRKRLEEADKAEEDLKQANKEIERYKKENDTLQEKLSAQLKLEISQKGLSTREAALSERENKLEITLLKAQLESEQAKSEFGFKVALGLVRNTEFRRNLTDSTSLPGIMNAQGYTTPQNTFQTSTEINQAE